MITTSIIERRFTSDGMTVSFPVDIEGIPDAPTGAAHLALSILAAGGEEAPLVYGADFSYAAVIVNGFSKSVIVTLAVPLPVGETLAVRRTTPVLSISSYPDDRTPPRQVERDIDNVVKILQEAGARAGSLESEIPAIRADLSSLHAADAQLAADVAAEAAARADADAAIKTKLDGIGIATTSRAGLVKPDGVSVTVDPDGTLHAASGGGSGTTDHRALSNRDAPGQHRDTSITRGEGPETVSEAITALEDAAAGMAISLAGIGGELASVTSDLAGKADVTAMEEALATLAPLESPALSGEPTAPTPDTDDDSDRIATTSHVMAVVNDRSASAPLPTSVNEVGCWKLIYFTGVNSFALPSGGTWAYFFVAVNGTAGLTHSFSRAGVAAGGTVVTGPLNSGTGSGFMWRIA